MCSPDELDEVVPGPRLVGQAPGEIPGVGFLQGVENGQEFVASGTAHRRSTIRRLAVFSGSPSQPRTAGVMRYQEAPCSVAAWRRKSRTSGCWRSRPSSSRGRFAVHDSAASTSGLESLRQVARSEVLDLALQLGLQSLQLGDQWVADARVMDHRLVDIGGQDLLPLLLHGPVERGIQVPGIFSAVSRA